MATEEELLNCFSMPGGQSITGRSSSIRNAFVAAIIPITKPSADEVESALRILGLNPNDVRCAYCGDRATEWDHLRPLVSGGKPTGYPSSIRNLVPACGKCNQSKGKTDWKVWMCGKARLSPTARGISDVAHRVKRLEDYERWASCTPLRIEELVDRSSWHKYYKLQKEILDKMREAQEIADSLGKQIRDRCSAGV
ncbi:MAG TPA: HNH endonuclease [Candidatus Dormibacteraeota bacterium]|nr:HNH endonuclease [Candidatus Dormibacteraeota bacterium]